MFSIILQYTSITPLGDRVLVKIKTSEEKTTGGILLPSTAQSKPQAGEVVAIGEGRTIGKKKIEIGVQVILSGFLFEDKMFYQKMSKRTDYEDIDVLLIALHFMKPYISNFCLIYVVLLYNLLWM